MDERKKIKSLQSNRNHTSKVSRGSLRHMDEKKISLCISRHWVLRSTWLCRRLSPVVPWGSLCEENSTSPHPLFFIRNKRGGNHQKASTAIMVWKIKLLLSHWWQSAQKTLCGFIQNSDLLRARCKYRGYIFGCIFCHTESWKSWLRQALFTQCNLWPGSAGSVLSRGPKRPGDEGLSGEPSALTTVQRLLGDSWLERPRARRTCVLVTVVGSVQLFHLGVSQPDIDINIGPISAKKQTLDCFGLLRFYRSDKKRLLCMNRRARFTL